jgi:hypothetical protein
MVDDGFDVIVGSVMLLVLLRFCVWIGFGFMLLLLMVFDC